MFQQIIVAGYLGQDPELRYTPTGTACTNFSLASSRKYTGGDGTLVEETTWFRVSVFGKQAETSNQYLKKGAPVLITGRLKPGDDGNPRTFQRQDGSVGSSFEIVADFVRFLPNGQDNQNGGYYDGHDSAAHGGGYAKGARTGGRQAAPARAQAPAPTQRSFAQQNVRTGGENFNNGGFGGGFGDTSAGYADKDSIPF